MAAEPVTYRNEKEVMKMLSGNFNTYREQQQQ
jgi:hypothetical protein